MSGALDFVGVRQIIVTRLTLVGSGKQDDPFRRVLQLWTMDGQRIATADPAGQDHFDFDGIDALVRSQP